MMPRPFCVKLGVVRDLYRFRCRKEFTKRRKFFQSLQIAFFGKRFEVNHKRIFAIAELDETLRLDPTLSLAMNARGYAYYLMKDYARALVDFDAAIRLNPNYANAYQNRAAARKRSGNIQGSTEDLALAQTLTK